MKRGKSSIESPEWLQNKTVTINPKNKKDAKTLPLNLQYIERDHRRMSKIEPFINHYNWKGPDFPSHQNDWEKFEKKEKTTTNALNISLAPDKTKEIRAASRPK